MSIVRPAAALMQPTFLPWQGYFALIASADHFVFLDDFQFVRRSFMHRNRLFLAAGNASWVSLPVEHGGRAALNEVRPILDDGFRTKFLASLKHAYAKAPFLAELLPGVRGWIEQDWQTLADLNIAFIERVAGWLDLRSTFHRSSRLGSEGKRSSRLASLLDRIGARTYLSARGSYAYMVEDAVFPLPGVETRFQTFHPQPYPQKQSPSFVPYLSVLDALLQVGPTRTRELITTGQHAFTPWVEMPPVAGALAPTPEEMIDDQSH
jgi:hypothetical protein